MAEVKNDSNGSSGELAVCVRFRCEAIPLCNASVKVYKHNGALTSCLPIADMKTDNSGKTAVIALPAPESAPYSLYDITASAEKMEACVIRGVQVFADTLCIQYIDLFPKSGAASAREITNADGEPFGGAYELIETAPHSLWASGGTFAEGDSFATQHVSGIAKNGVCVPEYVVVHDGPSNANAADYWLSYREYIKMAASQTISPRWHANAIRAGVLAITSLTLARSASKPYEPEIYTLTSDAKKDLPFSYGRCIYREISVIADEVFNNYIALPSEELPVAAGISNRAAFSAYSPLPLPETNSLAEKGYSTMNILKHFFGHGVYLETAPLGPRRRRTRIAVQPYPGNPLSASLNSTGVYVKIAQKLLNAASEAYPSIKKVKNDGVFGQETHESVISFQKIFFLDEDGVIGKSTWYRLWDIGG